MYVAVPQVSLRDRVAALYNKVGTVKAGDRVEVLDRQKRFAKVRSSSGQEGWMEERYLVDQKVFDQIQKLAADAGKLPPQGIASARTETNLHVAPGREAEHMFQLQEGEKAQVLTRATAERPGAFLPPPAGKKPGDQDGGRPQPVREDFWLVRSLPSPGHAGWVLGRMIDLDVPLEVAQYAEGQRIVAYFVLSDVPDGEKRVPQYLLALTETKDALPFDFNQIRVFTWNAKRHRYETAYRERKLFGLLPIHVGAESFDKEGRLPVFSFQVKDDHGNTAERKYKLNGPMVRRVLAPGEQPEPSRRRPAPPVRRRKAK